MPVERAEFLAALLEHLELAGIAVSIAVLVGVPLGAHLDRYRFLSPGIMALVGAIQTCPSPALLGIFVPLFGIGLKPALLALFLYALLPVVRNTTVGLGQIDPFAIEAARGMGMRERQILFRIRLPLALPVLVAGIRTATVISVGVATLGALVGAGGLGTFIFRGLAMVEPKLVLTGAIPAAILALVFDAALALIERAIVPRGLRPNSRAV